LITIWILKSKYLFLILRSNLLSILFATILIMTSKWYITLRCVWVIINISHMTIYFAEDILIQISSHIICTFFSWKNKTSCHSMSELPFLIEGFSSHWFQILRDIIWWDSMWMSGLICYILFNWMLRLCVIIFTPFGFIWFRFKV